MRNINVINSKIKYTINFKNGKHITESDYNWFIGNLDKVSTIYLIKYGYYFILEKMIYP